MDFELNYNKYLNYALHICGDKYLANDLVQDAYLKLYKRKNINNGYVYKTIKTIFLDQKRKKKEEVTLEYITNYTEQEEYEIKEEYDKVINELPFAIKECLLENQNYSLRKLEKRYNINYGKILRMVNKAKEQIKKNPKLKEYYGKD